MTLAVGDYVAVAPSTHGQHGRSGLRTRGPLRGTLKSLRDGWGMLDLPGGGRFEAPVDQLTLLVRGTSL